MNVPFVHDSKNGAVLTVHIQPNASRTQCAGRHGDALKVRIAAPPVDGAANEELIRFLAAQLHLPVADVRIESGIASRRKRLHVRGVTARFILAGLHLHPEGEAVT